MVNNSLEVGIIGGGLAGLSAAIALKRGGHKVEVIALLVLQQAMPGSTINQTGS
jgi:thioredoxin reductase